MHVEPLDWVTGPESPNRTDKHWQVSGTDLGIGVTYEDETLFFFGDTFHPRQSQGGGGGGDWRSNVLARSSSRNGKAIRIQAMVTDRPGHAREVLPSKKVNGTEMTVIPTGACSVRHRLYLAFMSVRRWGAPGRWETNYSGIAVSDDGGETWKVQATRLNNKDNSDPWQMLTLVHHDRYVYIYGTPAGRAGAARLARVGENDLLSNELREYWDGSQWSTNEQDADPVIAGPVSELSIAYHSASGKWLAAYFREGMNSIVVHTAAQPVGPWSAPHVVATAKEYPGLYGAFFHPRSMDQPYPVFLMSLWLPYNVRAMRLVGLVDAPIPLPWYKRWFPALARTVLFSKS